MKVSSKTQPYFIQKSTLWALIAAVVCVMPACRPTLYTQHTTNQINSSVVLDKRNFNSLGTFTGIATARTSTIGVKNREGVISEARKNLLANAKLAGVELTGARTLTNMSIDAVSNSRRVTVTVVAEIIEFTE